jgi:hypothetical protein
MRLLQLQNLENAQQKSLDDCALALQSIVELEKLAIFASKGLDRDRIKVILSKYGLEAQF